MNSTALGIALLAFLVAMFAIGFWSQGRIRSTEDYLVAGRRLPLSLATATLFATWFGAGTLLTSTDEVRMEGLRAAGLEPIGTGLCLVAAGIFFARRLWAMKLLTLPEFYGRRFGVRTEVAASLIMVPGYFGWIAAQFVALGGLLEIFWGVPLVHGIWIVAVVGTGYTLLGGMWSVTLTDAVQLVLLLIGLVILGFSVLAGLGDGDGLLVGWTRLTTETPPDMLVLVPTGSTAEALGWFSLVCVGILGNLPGQDLTQRIFSARSSRVAVWACLIGGVLYVVLGMVPVLSGLAADLLLDGSSESATVPALASLLLSPALGVVFVLALVAAVMSTIDSAILAPSSVLANDLMRRLWPEADALRLSRWAVLGVATLSLVMAYAGQDAYELLETAYAIGMVGLFVPLALGIYGGRGGEAAALVSMAIGVGTWGVHLALGWESFGGERLGLDFVPQELAATVLAWVAYEVVARVELRAS